MIDVRELRIGAHVLVKGIRAEVVEIKDITIKPEYHISQIKVAASLFGKKTSVVVMSSSNEIEPIPITPGLLEELGFGSFVERGEVYWRKVFDNGMYVIVKINASGCVTRIHSCRVIHDIIHFKYLHELENIVYLTTKEELIKKSE